MPQTDPWTIGRLLQWTTQFLKERGADSPRLDAEVLLAHARGCRRIELYTAFEEEPAEPVRTAFRDLVKRRAEGTPVAYLVGRREFYSQSFRVTPDVLIPRPETEFLLIRLLDLASARDAQGEGLDIVDVGTGSGILAICAAQRLPRANVTAIDISPAALAVANANAAEHRVVERISFVEGELFSGLDPTTRFDFVVSNPPYVTEDEYKALPRDVRDYEPRGALVAGKHGTEVIERLVSQAADRLKSGGWLLVEISPMLAAAVQSIVEREERLELHAPIHDLAGHARVVQARKRTE
jgi:release factor glutamine methyltransferase